MTDEELMLAVCKGDQSAYQTLVKRHLRPISHYAFRLLGNNKDTEDIAQETFLRLWINACSWQADKAKLSTWLHRITHNLCVDYLRKHSRMQTRANVDEEEDNRGQTLESDAGLHGESFGGVNENLDGGDRLRKLRTAMVELPENQRSALMLCHYQGFSNKEAAAIMNISVKAIESTLARGKRSLRKKIAEVENNIDNTLWGEEIKTHQQELK
jgi:RNA polymerase sigma-70 factor (ECF subfamily)